MRMEKCALLAVIMLMLCCRIIAQNKHKIIIEMNLDKVNPGIDSFDIEYTPVGCPGEFSPEKLRQAVSDKKATILSGVPVYISLRSYSYQHMNWFAIAEPGDSIVISEYGGSLSFRGKGSEKFFLARELTLRGKNILKPANPVAYNTRSIADYLEWNTFLNRQLSVLLPLVDSLHSKISAYSYLRIKAAVVKDIEQDRHNKFRGLYSIYIREGNLSGLTNKNLCDIYDSTFFSKSAIWMRSLPVSQIADDGFVDDQILRSFKFPTIEQYKNIVTDRLQGYIMHYEQAKKEYKGLALEDFLANLMTAKVIRKIGFNEATETLLAKYYAEPGDPIYKKYVKEYELKKRVLQEGENAPDFFLKDKYGHSFSNRDFKGKIILISFWSANDNKKVGVENKLKQMMDEFKNDTNVVLLKVRIDNNTTTGQRNAVSDGENWLTPAQGENNALVKAYNLLSYPALYLVGPEGKVILNPLPGLEMDNGKELHEVIKDQLALLQDGPYVMYENNVQKCYYFDGNSAIEQENRDKSEFFVQTDNYNEKFSVRLKSNLSIEPSLYPEQQKIFVLSDIEGDFRAFKKLLQVNGIIDANYNWTFGTGHLVCNGDFFDRGQQVTEVLWLIYSLEEKAKRAGGYVHFILGNHEIMNLNNDVRYVRQKYKDNASKIVNNYNNLYGEDSELGRWLRTKNIIEKIGGVIFVHGGISKEVNDLSLPIDKINELARPYYTADNIARNSSNTALSLIYSYSFSPFWYRQYYQDQEVKVYSNKNGLDTVYKTPVKVIDEILNEYGATHIVTGHTHVMHGDKITVHYEGKILNTDTDHAGGKSEALVITEDKYYSVNDRGEKELLFAETKSYTSNSK